MRTLPLSRLTMPYAALFVMMAGCNNSGLQPAASGVPESNASYRLLPTERVTHSNSQRSWMSPAARALDLLYVANLGNGTVSIFSWPKLKLVGMLTGFNQPGPMCVDKASDIYITDFPTNEIYEFAHGSTVPLQTLADPGGGPEACSVDLKTGNLAVTNLLKGSSAGNLEIYPGGTGTPTAVTDPNIYAYWWPAYDGHGNLFFNGFDQSFGTLYTDELLKGGKLLRSITLNQQIGFPSGLLWDGKYLACEDATVNVIYQFAVSGSTGTVVGSTNLGGATSVFQFWVTGRSRAHPEGTTVVGADANANNNTGAAEIWHYPAGGSAPTKEVTQGLDAPDGAVVSPKR
jgi:outer membrane protein assembly factor BamB